MVSSKLQRSMAGILALFALSCGSGEEPNKHLSQIAKKAPGGGIQLPGTQTAVRLTAPRDGESFSSGAEVWLEAAVSPAADVAAVRFLSNGRPVGEVRSPPYRLKMPSTGYGTFLIRARAITGAGERLDSVPASIRVMAPAGSDREMTAQEMSAVMSRPEGVAIALLRPRAEAVFHAPADVDIEAAVVAHQSQVHRVTILADGRVLAALSKPPYRFLWTSVAAGRHAIVVQAENQDSARTEAAVDIDVR